jgi:hypothetical protein
LAAAIALVWPLPAVAVEAMLGARVLPNPITVDLALDRTVVEQGVPFLAVAGVENTASYDVLEAELSVRSDGELLVLDDGAPSAASLPGGSRHSSTWSLCAPTPGNYLIVAAASARSPDGDEFAAESQARLIEVTVGERVCGGFAFDGFVRPVDNPPTVNLATAGSSIPLKFRLGGDHGLDVVAAGYPASVRVDCDTRDPTDVIEQTVAAGNSALTYDSATDTYTYAWKTDRRWSGTCRQLSLVLTDGTVHRAEFRFRR